MLEELDKTLFIAMKLTFLPSVRPMRKCRVGKQNLTQVLPWETSAALPRYLSFFEIPTLFCPNVTRGHSMPVPLTHSTVQAFVAAIMKLKARAGIIFRNCEKSNDGNPQNR